MLPLHSHRLLPFLFGLRSFPSSLLMQALDPTLLALPFFKNKYQPRSAPFNSRTIPPTCPRFFREILEKAWKANILILILENPGTFLAE
jgi:hypothetical protein